MKGWWLNSTEREVAAYFIFSQKRKKKERKQIRFHNLLMNMTKTNKCVLCKTGCVKEKHVQKVFLLLSNIFLMHKGSLGCLGRVGDSAEWDYATDRLLGAKFWGGLRTVC